MISARNVLKTANTRVEGRRGNRVDIKVGPDTQYLDSNYDIS